jgi:signal transduction histidine kinase
MDILSDDKPLRDDRPLHDVRAYQMNEERRQWISFAILTTIIMIGGFLVFLFAYYDQIKPGVDRKILTGLYGSTLALILACAYFFAFRFFDNLFYLFVSIGWLANAGYLPFEFLFDSKCDPTHPITSACLEFSLYTYAISFVSSISFYTSTLTKPRDISSYSVTTVLGLWSTVVIAFTVVGYLLLNYVWPTSDAEFKFAVYTIPGSLFSAHGLLRVGQYITGVLKHSKGGRDLTLKILSWTFYTYAVLQLTYPFKIYFIKADVNWIFHCFFIAAFAIKLTSVYCLVKVLLTVKYPEFVQAKSEVEALQERLNRQSELAALGAIAASIEHDMKTPLSGISTKLETMRRLYPDGKIRRYIEKLEIDKNRIAAIAKVVPFMRGNEDFYNRDRFMGKVSINELINLAIRAVKVEMSLDTEKFFFRINPDARAIHKNTEHFVRAYTPMLEQMVVNLFKNGIEAIKETGKDRGVITIRVNTARTIPEAAAAGYNLKKFAKWVRVEIEDNGCGIAQENMSRLTSLFTTKNDRKPNGGIGLFIARRLIKIHDGCMGISSVVGKGTIVTFYLPEWEAYQNYVLGHPATVEEDYDLDNDLAMLDASSDERQETPAIAE